MVMVQCCRDGDCDLCTTFVFKAKIGSGSYSKVFKVINERECEYALKVIKKGKMSYKEFILCDLEHPNIIKLLDYFENENYCAVVMDIASGTLEDVKVSHRKLMLEYILPLCDAIMYLHKEGVIHRDIKPENVLLIDKRPVLSDFGLSRNLIRSPVVDDTAGTLKFVAPEVVNPIKIKSGGYDISYPSDVWSIGVTIYYLLHKKYPFGNKIAKEYMDLKTEYIQNCIMDYNYKVRRTKYKSVYINIFVGQEERPTIKEVIKTIKKILYRNSNYE